MTKVIKSNTKDGKELLTLLDENGESSGFQVTMESVFEERESEEINAFDILKPVEVEDLKTSKKITRCLELNQQVLLHKETGEIFTVKMGNIPPIDERIRMDYTASFVTITPASGGEDVYLTVPFKKDGTIPEKFPYIIKEENNGPSKQ